MSVNLSLGDTPGVSAYFDGQPIQDELEAEIRREEERQEKELRDLLATELEDFEEDFLSDSNSEEDSVNVSRASRVSNHSHRVRQNEQQRAMQAPEKLAQLASDSSGSNKGRIGEQTPDAYYSPLAVRQPQHHHLHHQQEHHSSQYSQDSNQNHPGQFVQSSQGHEFIKPVEGHNIFQSYSQGGDDWMMKVQQTHTAVTSSSSPHRPQSINPRVQQPQFFPSIPHPNINGIIDNPPLSSQAGFHSPAVQSPLAQPSISKAVFKTPGPTSASDRAGIKTVAVSDKKEEYDDYQVQYKSKPKRNDINENDFYLHNENVEFFRADGSEEKQSYQQLEVLYRARGRELEDLTWKLKQAEEEAAKETRMYKHKLALASGDLEGGQESLRQCQSLLQQTKSDLAESQALVRSLETQVASLKEAKEELIKKLQVAESTIENLSHQCEELQQSESLSRARNEHENVVASLTQRFDRELLATKEKLDETKSSLEAKHEETIWLKKQLADSTKELEQAQISRGETINRLAKSLEDSQRQCQALLEQSSSQEIASLKVKLQQTIASKSVSEETCIGLQSEIKELREQLSMFESASALGAVTSSVSHNKVSGGTGLDDSMTDLGIKKTLDFDTPSSTPKLADTSSLEELVTSLRSELEKCLHSNRQKRAEIAEKAGEICTLKQELQMSQSKSQDLEKTCFDQKMKLKDLESLMTTSNGESILEVRLRREMDALAKDKAILLEDVEDYKKRLEEVGASESKLTEINTELSAQIAQMVSDFDCDKATALDRCQRTLEEVHQLSMNNLRTELEDRLASEKAMLAECHKMELDRIKVQLNAAQEEVHSVKSLYIKTCDEMKNQEEDTRASIRKEVEEELANVSRCKEEAKEKALIQEEKNKRLGIEESFAKEKKTWNDEKESYKKEIKASTDIIAHIRASREKDVSDLQEEMTSLKSRHKEEMDALNDKLTNLVSCHQAEMKKMQEESNTLSEMKIHFENKLELVEKQFKTEKEELNSLLQQERKVKLAVDSTADSTALNCSRAERKDASVQIDLGNQRSIDVDSQRERLLQVQEKLESVQEEHQMALINLKAEHKKEFERAARNREEKFQVELRYFLKDKDDKFREKLDQELKKSKEDATLRYEKAIQEKEGEIEHLKKQLDSLHQITAHSKMEAVSHSGAEIMTDMVNKLNAEKGVMEKRIQDLEREKMEELSELIENHAKENRSIIEKFEKEIEVLVLNHKAECAELHKKISQLEERHRHDVASDNLEEDEDVRKVVSARVREERALWFKDAQEYIKNEIESGIAERDQDPGKDDAWAKKLNEEVKRNVEAELDRMKTKMELEIEKEVEQRLQEQLSNEVKKLKTEERKKESENKKTIDTQVKQKLSVEVENLKTKFLSELEAKVAKEKDLLEQDVRKWKLDMKEKIDGDRKVFLAQVNRDMEMKISEERKKTQVETMQSKQEELRQLRDEMEEEMRKRIEREKMDWQREEEETKKRIRDAGGEDEISSASAIRNQLRTAEEVCNKAYRERERAIELLKMREASYKKDKEKLVAGLKQLREDLNATKEEQAVLEEKYAQMDRKYKEDMKEAKKKKEQALEKLHARREEEKENIISDYKNRMASMKEDFCTEMDKVKSEAEMERAALLTELRSHAEKALTLSPLQETDAETTSLFALRNHYLETVSKIKEDVMSHVQAANSRAATTMKSEMRKQRRRLVQVFKERCKSSIRSILAGQVSLNVLNALDHAIDVIAEAMVNTPKSSTSTSTATAWSPSNFAGSNTTPESRTPRDNRSRDQPITSGERFQGSNTRPERREREAETAKNPLGSSDEFRTTDNHLQGPIHPMKLHPQLAKVDLYDSEAVDSSPQTSHHSSPAMLHTKSVFHSKTLSSPPVPRLDLSPFHVAKETDHSTPSSEQQKRHPRHADRYLHKTNQKPNRPRSAESTKVPYELQQTGMSKPLGEPSPRDRMKVIEAQVRLANWAASGEMPWKATKSQDGAMKNNNGDAEERDEDLFIRPGEEAERFLKAHSSAKKKENGLVTPMKKDRFDMKSASRSVECIVSHLRKPPEIDGYITDDSNVSSASHSSYVTLEPDATQKSHFSFQSQTGKGSDCDRIKAAVLDPPDERFLNVTHKRTPRMSHDISSDDDAKSVDSDAPLPGSRGLPTSTPLKRTVHRHQGSTINPDRHNPLSMQNLDSDSDQNAEQELGGWKSVNAFSNFPTTKSHQKKQSTQHPQSSNRSQRRAMDNVKSVDFEFPDVSEIEQTSGDGLVGREVWRCKSLEELLPHHVRGRADPCQYRNNNPKPAVHAGYKVKDLSVAKRAPPPIQAMNSDFWREQTLEDGNNCDGYDDQRVDSQQFLKYPNHRENLHFTRHATSAVNKNSSNSNEGGHRKKIHGSSSKYTESSWAENEKRSHKNPSHSSNMAPHRSSSRQRQQNALAPSYSYSQFDTHVDDLRKSLESMGGNPFSSMPSKKGSKSKMKRSVSEQSLHTIQWDQSGSADIDDLVNAYTTGGPALSHFDLHNFGHEEAF